MNNISEKLKMLRKVKGYTIQNVANGAQIPYRTYQNYEYGEREIGVEALAKLADFYGVTTDYLLDRENSNVPVDPIEELIRQRNLTPLERKILEEYMALPDNARANVMDFLKRAVAEKEKNNHGGE